MPNRNAEEKQQQRPPGGGRPLRRQLVVATAGTLGGGAWIVCGLPLELFKGPCSQMALPVTVKLPVEEAKVSPAR